MHAQLIAAASAAVAVFALWQFFVRLQRDRVVADTPTVRIRSAAQGYVKLAGKALPAGPAPTSAPLSARPCVWWDFVIAHQETDSRGNTRWHQVDRATSVKLFVLQDDDGARCLVGPVTAEVTPTDKNVWYGALPRPTGPLPESHSQLDSGEWRYTERLLDVGTHVRVMGELRSHSRSVTSMRPRRRSFGNGSRISRVCWRASIPTTTATWMPPSGRPHGAPPPAKRRRRHWDRTSRASASSPSPETASRS